MLSQYIRDEIAWLRAEAARFRNHAKYSRLTLKLTKNPVEKLKLRSRIGEYVLAAQQRDRMAKELREQHSQKKPIDNA